MFSEAHTPANARPAVVDGQVVLLPTLVGLMNGHQGVEGAPSRDLWSALAAAVMAEQAFEAVDSGMAEGQTLADVIDLEARRRHSN